MTKFVNFAVRFSPNLGDGLIAECLAYGIRAQVPAAEVVSVDLAGRTYYGAKTLRNRQLALQVLKRLPGQVRTSLVANRLEKALATLAPTWNGLVAGADGVIIGGGQLFSDADLNFPLKVAQAVRSARYNDVPVAVYGVGVSRNWSSRGAQLFGELKSVEVPFIGVRDQGSMEAWNAQLAELKTPKPELTRDPGLLAAECYGPGRMTGTIGVGVTAQDVLAYHSDAAVAGAAQGIRSYLAGVVTELARRGHRVTLFCNGATEDRRTLALVADSPQVKALIQHRRVLVAPHPETPEELAHTVSSFRAVLSHRLHACIVAYAYRIPAVGLSWDKKVQSFFESVGRQAYLGMSDGLSAADTASLVERSLSDSISQNAHQRVVDEAKEGISRLLAAFKGASTGQRAHANSLHAESA